MKRAKKLPTRASARRPAKTQVYSTSEARANFAAALEAAQRNKAVIGFDRYGRTVAALVPVEAVYMLAGMGGEVAANVRKGIEAAARTFAQNAARDMDSEPRERGTGRGAEKPAGKRRAVSKKKSKSKRPAKGRR